MNEFLSADRPNASPQVPIQIAVIGDIHDAWETDDEVALKHLGIDLCLFVGDFGNEAVELVQQIAAMPIPKAVILGNHDAWYSASDWGKSRCPYDRTKEDRVQAQLNALGELHVGYGKLDFPELQLSVVGSRPFSWGGSVWKNEAFYQERYGITSFAESTQRIVAAAQQATYETVIFLGHCGPKGLGDRPEDPCGKDWNPIGGDYGDPDLQEAIAQTQQLGKSIPLVAFGHMHHHLRHTQQYFRTALRTDSSGTIYVNAARVPRIMEREGQRLRNFTLATLVAGVVAQVALVWLDNSLGVYSREILYTHKFSGDAGTEQFAPAAAILS